MTNLHEQLQELLDKSTPEELRREVDKRAALQTVEYKGKYVTFQDLPWWRKDKNGWPIETVRGRRMTSFTRLVAHNIGKIFP